MTPLQRCVTRVFELLLLALLFGVPLLPQTANASPRTARTKIIETAPDRGATGVNPDATVSYQFSGTVEVDGATARVEGFRMMSRKPGKKPKLRSIGKMSATLALGDAGDVVQLVPSNGLEENTVYRCKVSGIRDARHKRVRISELKFTTGARGSGTPTPTPTPTNGTLITPQDFTFLGYYDMHTLGLDSPFFQGLTHRYVNGDLRLLTYHHWGNLYEVSLAGKNYGDIITTTTNAWDLNGVGVWDFLGLWWNEAQSQLWTVTAVDYTVNTYPVQLYTRQLNSDGTVSNLHGPVGLQGISAKRVYGGIQPVPSWFQAQYGVGPYVTGWGGYTSLVMAGGGASMGPTMYSIPDPSGYANDTEVPSSAFKTIMDSGGAPAQDWYPSGAPTSYDRGSRVTIPENYFDGGDTRPNGNCPTCNATTPTVPPVTGAQWLSPAPDGLGRWVWGDSNYNTGLWIDTPTKQGFMTIASLGGGKTWYCASTLCYQSRVFEMQIWDPATLGEAAQGLRPVWNVKPTYMQQLTLPGLGFPAGGNGSIGNVSGATFDTATRRLYLLGPGVNTYDCRIYVFQMS